MLTPQDLINLPGYGSAEKHLREQGQWSLTTYDTISSTQKQDTETLPLGLGDTQEETQ